MKKASCFIILFIMIFTAWSSSAETQICWSTERLYTKPYDGPDRAVYVMRKNGEYETYGLDLLFVIRDLEEFPEAVGVAFQRTVGNYGLTFYTMDADGRAQRLFSYKPEVPEGFREVRPQNVVAYIHGYLYYYLINSEGRLAGMRRDDMNGNTFEYETYSQVLSLEGQIAWAQNVPASAQDENMPIAYEETAYEETGLYVQKPGEEARLILPSGAIEGKLRYMPFVWLDERTLLTWAFNEYMDTEEVHMYKVDVETREWSPWLTQEGQRIRYDDKMPTNWYYTENVQVDLSGRYLAYWYCKPVWDMTRDGSAVVLDLQTGTLEVLRENQYTEEYGEYNDANRAVWLYD